MADTGTHHSFAGRVAIRIREGTSVTGGEIGGVDVLQQVLSVVSCNQTTKICPIKVYYQNLSTYDELRFDFMYSVKHTISLNVFIKEKGFLKKSFSDCQSVLPTSTSGLDSTKVS